MATKLLSIEKAMKSDEVSLKNESIFDNENVASLKEMLYSIPNSINKNIYIHNLFMDEEFEDETDVKTERKTVNEKGARIRKLILTKQDKNKKISSSLLSDVLSTESDEASDSSSESGSSSSSESSIETDDNSVFNLKNAKTEKENNETIAKEESKKEKNASKPEETYPPMTQPVIIDFGDESESEDSEPEIRSNEDENESESGSEFDDSESYDIEFSDSESEESEPSSSISSSIDFDDLTNDNDISSTTSAESYDEVEDNSSEESDINEYEISNDESENLSFTENDYDYSDVSVDEENENNNLQDVPKEDKEGKKEKPDKNQKGEEPEFQWKDQSIINEDYADELREKARRIASLDGPYGMATEEGIDKLSNLLDDVLDYSSGISSKNNPIKELVRNFNSIKTIQRGLVGNKKDLDVVATNINEIKKNANEVSKARAAEISMQKTYLDKIIALNRFEYSEEIETMLRNALFDIHTNISQNKNSDKDANENSDKDANENSDKDAQETAKDEVFQNVGKILLPLLRTKNEPMNYNYDFQYDILKEIIRQEDFFSEIEGRSSYSDDDKSSLKVDPISSFILLRYLKTILNYNGKAGKGSSSIRIPTEECFNSDGNLETTFGSIIESTNISSFTKDTLNPEQYGYSTYLADLKKFVDSYNGKDKKGEINNKLKDLLSEANKTINENYIKVKQKLSLSPIAENINIKLLDVRTALRKLLEEINRKDNRNEDLSAKLKDIIKNMNSPSNLVEVCGQKTAILENLKEMYKEARKHKATKPSTKPEEKKDATTTAAAPPNSATTAT